MKGGRGLEFRIRILKNELFKNHLESFLTVKTCFALREAFKNYLADFFR